jgi:hypothetical protein
MTLTLAALIVAAVALGAAAVAIWLAVLARGEAITCRRELARHRHSHAQQAEEQPAARHSARPGPPPAVTEDGPATEALPAMPSGTAERPAAVRLPRPGRIGTQQ